MKISSLMGLVSAGVLTLGASFLPAGASMANDMYASWDADLHKYVDGNGNVNYRSWKANRTGVDSFLASASKITAEDYSHMSKEQKLALWINLYNAGTIKQILDHYPIHKTGLNFYPDSSIRQIDGVWDKYKLQAAGKQVSLSDIENKILRGEFKEPLIHFAINCASHGCPKILNRSYNSDTIYKDMEASAHAFVHDSDKNRIDTKQQKLELSRIFEWFGDDFKERYGGSQSKNFAGRSTREAAVLNFLVKHVDGSQKEMIQANKFALNYRPYDWSLNEQGASK